MGWRHSYNNHLAREQGKQDHTAARWALERFRHSGNTTEFPALKKWVGGHHGFSLAGYQYEDVTPPLTEEEYKRFEAAYEASDAGIAARAEFEEWLRNIQEE